MTYEIVAVGKIKEKFLAEAISEYKKRLSKFCELKVTEIMLKPRDLKFFQNWIRELFLFCFRLTERLWEVRTLQIFSPKKN